MKYNEIVFKNTLTGEIVTVKLGFSWILFFFYGFVGLPFFLKKANFWGVMGILIPTLSGFVSGFLAGFIAAIMGYSEDVTFGLYISFASIFGLLISIFFGLQGTSLIAKELLKKGYKITSSEEFKINLAKIQWDLSDTAFEKAD